MAVLLPEKVGRSEREALQSGICRELAGRAGGLVTVACGNPERYQFPPNALVVDSQPSYVRRDVAVLSPQRETQFARGDADASGPILVPLGNRASSRTLLERGLPLVAELGRPVVFYHTTYPAAGVDSADPWDHANAAARNVIHEACAHAGLAGIDFRVVVEMAPEICTGIAGAALANGCSMILITRDTEMRGRCYADEVLECSPVPVLVLGTESAFGTLDVPHANTRIDDRPSGIVAPKTVDESSRGFFRTAYGVMSVTAGQYLVKILVKGGFGLATGSALFLGDAAHNGTDLAQAFLVVVLGVWLAARALSRAYPLGWRGLDTVASLGIGLSLLYVAVINVLVPSLFGIASVVPGLGDVVFGWTTAHAVSESMGGANGAIAVAIMLASAGASQLVGRYQIRVGRETGHASVVADGEETLSDGRVELLAAAGFAIRIAAGLPWVEHALGIGMAGIMLHTAREILGNAWDMILSRSLGEEKEEEIRAAVLSVSGVDGVDVVTYRRGTGAVVDLVVRARLAPVAFDLVRSEVARRVRALFPETEISLSLRPADRKAEVCRWAFLARKTVGAGEVPQFVADPVEAESLLICNVVDGEIVGWRQEPVAVGRLAELLAAKMVERLYVPVMQAPGATDQLAPARYEVGGTVQVLPMATTNPGLLGLPLR